MLLLLILLLSTFITEKNTRLLFNLLLSRAFQPSNLHDLRFKNLTGVATDGARSMIGRQSGLVALLKKQGGIDKNPFVDRHCIIHLESSCAKTLRFHAVIKVINQIKNQIFIILAVLRQSV